MKKLKKNKTYLVTGGTGFIGSNIVKLLIKKNCNVIVFDNNSRGGLGKLKHFNKKFKFIKGDIRDKKKVLSACKNVDAVIHLAYVNGTKYFYKHPIKILEIAIKGILNIVESCIEKNIKELYLASSSEVYQTPNKIPTDENEMLKIPDIYNPRYSYGGGKILTELIGINYGRKYFKKLIIFRPHNVYGPDMGNEHVIPELINRFKNLKGQNFKIQGTGKEIRSFIYIDDFIDAFNLIIKKGKHLSIYNIGTSEKINIKFLTNKISKILNKKIKIISSPIQKGGTKIRLPNILKIKKLGFKQKYRIVEGLKKTISFYY
mgnify:FL=1|tara:strand:- start:137 stop:1087 length:951 start_codon:yes stop_codon:yes gene_type:complete